MCLNKGGLPSSKLRQQNTNLLEQVQKSKNWFWKSAHANLSIDVKLPFYKSNQVLQNERSTVSSGQETIEISGVAV